MLVQSRPPLRRTPAADVVVAGSVGGGPGRREVWTVGDLQLNPLRVERRQLFTRLTPEACEHALEAALRTAWWSTSVQVAGTATRDGSTLRLASGWPFFRTAASGTLSAVPDGTAIAVRLALDSASASRGLGALAALLVALLVCSNTASRRDALWVWFAEDTPLHLGVAALGVVVAYILSRWLTRGDADALLAFVRETLEAKAAPGPA